MPPKRRQRRSERAYLDATPPWETRVREDLPPTTGPYDERDAPDDDVPRVDLGALRVPVADGFEMRLDLNEAQQVLGVTLAGPEGTMQLGVFAAPRNEGLWDEVRAEMAESLRTQRGVPKERHDGPFGVELHAMVAGDGGAKVPVRFVGIDGPRWFLRATFVGNIASEPSKAARFERTLRNVVVVRGNEPLPVRDQVPLQLPKQLTAEGDEAAGEAPGEHGEG
ncbi:MAG TPA: DUF3710 domain-containing protein [Jatrophihabitantaceae bacterium]|nr:DUF3710 domain-containing protein [Jatrophihabitantaceae bacterium]